MQRALGVAVGSEWQDRERGTVEVLGSVNLEVDIDDRVRSAQTQTASAGVVVLGVDVVADEVGNLLISAGQSSSNGSWNDAAGVDGELAPNLAPGHEAVEITAVGGREHVAAGISQQVEVGIGQRIQVLAGDVGVATGQRTIHVRRNLNRSRILVASERLHATNVVVGIGIGSHDAMQIGVVRRSSGRRGDLGVGNGQAQVVVNRHVLADVGVVHDNRYAQGVQQRGAANS